MTHIIATSALTLTPETQIAFAALPAYYLFLAFCTWKILKKCKYRYPLSAWVPFLRTYRIFKATEDTHTLVFTEYDPWIGLFVKLVLAVMIVGLFLMYEVTSATYFLHAFSIIIEFVGLVRLSEVCQQPIRQVLQQAMRLSLRFISPILLLAAIYIILAMIAYTSFIIFTILGSIGFLVYLIGMYPGTGLDFLAAGVVAIANFFAPIIGFGAQFITLLSDIGHRVYELSIVVAPSILLCAPMAAVGLIYSSLVANLPGHRQHSISRTSSR